MCSKIKIINQTNLGSLTKCECGLYVLQFNNVFLEFNKDELLSFKKHISIDSTITLVRLFSPYANHSQYQISAGEDK